MIKESYLRGSEEFGVIELDLSFSIKACSVSEGSSVSSPVAVDSTLSTVCVLLDNRCSGWHPSLEILIISYYGAVT